MGDFDVRFGISAWPKEEPASAPADRAPPSFLNSSNPGAGSTPGYKGPSPSQGLRVDFPRVARAGDAAALRRVGETSRRQAANAAIFLEADRLRREKFLPALPEHVQEHILRTGDWSVLSEDYRGKPLPEGWNAERLNDMPLLQALREKRKSDPGTAARWSELLRYFAQPASFAAGPGAAPAPAELDAHAERLLDLLASEPGAPDPRNALSAWLQETRAVEEEHRPEIFFSPETQVAKLRDLAALLQGLGEGKEEYRRLRESDMEASSEGGNPASEADSDPVQAFQAGLEETRDNFAAAFHAFVAAFARDLENYQIQVRRLGKLDEDNSAPYQVQLKEALAALRQAEATLAPSGDLFADLDAMIAAAQCLAGAQARMLQGVSLIEISNFKGFAPGRMQVSAKTSDWIADPRWPGRARELERVFGEFSILDAEGIHRLLRAHESRLREVLPEKFQEPKVSLKAALAEQISLWTKARGKKIDNGDDVRDYDRLLQDYRAAESALDAGDLPRALALFRIATDGKRRASLEEDFSEFQSRQAWKAFALEIAVLTAAGLATAATLGALLPAEVAAVSAGTAALGTEVFVAGMEGAAMTGSELLIRKGLYEAAERGGKRHGLSVVEDPALKFEDAGDLAWKAVATAGMLRFLKGAGHAYQGAVLGEQALSRAGARALLDTAAQAGAGRAMGRRLLDAEFARLGLGGKALYQAGAFGTEAAALQAWANIAAPLDMLYARVSHGRKLRWDGLSERLAAVNSVDAIEESLRTLAGLKLGGRTAHPVGARLRTRAEKNAALRARFETLQSTQQAFLKKYQELRGRARGDALDPAGDGALRAEAERLAELMKDLRGEIGGLKRKGKSLLGPKEEALFLAASGDFLAWVEGAGKMGKITMGPLAVGLLASWPSVADAMSLASSTAAQAQDPSSASQGLWALAAGGLAIGVGAVFGSRHGSSGGEPPPDSAAKRVPVVTFPDGTTRYSLGAYRQGARDTWPEGQVLGRVLWTAPLEGDPEGSMNLEVLPFQGALGPIVMDPVQATITAEQAAALGIPPGSRGDFAEASAPLLKLIPISPPPKRSPAPPVPSWNEPTVFRASPFGMTVEREIQGRNYSLVAASPLNFEDWSFRVDSVSSDASGRVRVEGRLRKNRYLDEETPLSLSLSRPEAEHVGLGLNDEGRWEESEPAVLKLIPRGPTVMPAFPLEGPLPQGVAAVAGDNREASPRRGEIGVPGQSSGQTHEGVGYKPRNEDALVEGPGWAAVIDGMGGHADGDRASAIVGKALAHYLEAHKNDSIDPKELVRQALVYAGDAVNHSPYIKQDAAAVAMVQLRIPMEDGRTKLILGWVGDAGAVIVRPDGTFHRTEDQSVLRGVLRRKDKSPEALELEKRAHPRNSISAGSLGGREEAVPSVEEHLLEPGSRVALFSDGFDSLSSGEIAEILQKARSPEEASRESFGLAKQKMEILTRAKANLSKVYPGFERMSREEREKLRIFIVTPRGDHAYIDVRGRVYRLRSGGELIDFYKSDNLTVYVAFF